MRYFSTLLSLCLLLAIRTEPTSDYRFLAESTIDITTGADAIYTVDWTQQNQGSLQPPLLAAGGSAQTSRSCTNPNIFIYSLNNTCLENSSPRIFAITTGIFDSDTVNSVRWCSNQNTNCPAYPHLAVGGKTAPGTIPTNIRLYYINSSDYSLNSYAYAATNSLSSITAVDWNPACKCSHVTAGGCQVKGNQTYSIIEYNKTKSSELADIEHILCNTNVTSLEWCQSNTISINACVYLAVGTTGTAPYKELPDLTDQIIIYKAIFCKNGIPCDICQR